METWRTGSRCTNTNTDVHELCVLFSVHVFFFCHWSLFFHVAFVIIHCFVSSCVFYYYFFFILGSQ